MKLLTTSCAKALGLLALILLSTQGSAAPDPLRILYAPPHVIRAAGADAELTLPVAIIAGTPPSGTCLQKAGVRPENGSDTHLIERFVLAPHLIERPHTAPAISLTIKDVATLAAGKYELMVYAFDCDAVVPAKSAEPFVIALIRPAAKLEQPGRIVIERWMSSPWADTAERVWPASIALIPASTSGATGIRGLTAQPATFTTGDNNTPVGKVMAQLPASVAHGAPVNVAFSLLQFPVGSANGYLTLHSPDLAEPLRLDLEIRSRLAPYWIIVVVVAGIVLGWATRVWLQRKIELAQARQPALEWVQALRLECDKIPDPEFRRVVGAQIAAVETGLSKVAPADVTSALSKAAPVVDTAREDLQTRLATVDKQIREFLDGCDVALPLPEALNTARSKALAAGAAAADLLASFNATAAETALETARRRLAEQLPQVVHGLRERVQELGTALSPLKHVINGGTAEQLDNKIANAHTSVQVLDPADTYKLLRDTAQVVHLVRELLLWSAGTLENAADTFYALVHGRQNKKDILAAERAAFREQLHAYAGAIRTQAQREDPVTTPGWKPAKEVWTAAGADLLEALALARIASGQKPEDLAAFRKAVHSGNWVAGLEELARGWDVLGGSVPARAGSAGFGGLDAPFERRVQTLSPLAHTALSTGRQSAQGSPQVSFPDRSPHGLSPQRNFFQLALSEAAMSVIVAVLLAWASFAFYEEKFIGTWGELLALFLWGFSADLSAQKLTEKIQTSNMLPK